MAQLTEIQRKALVRLNQSCIADDDPQLIAAHRKAFAALEAKGLARLVTDPDDETMRAWEITEAGEAAI